MSKQANVVQKFSHLIEQGECMSQEQIAAQSLEMMQMLANCPKQRSSWLSLKEALEMIYHNLDSDEQATLLRTFDPQIEQSLQRITR